MYVVLHGGKVAGKVAKAKVDVLLARAFRLMSMGVVPQCCTSQRQLGCASRLAAGALC